MFQERGQHSAKRAGSGDPGPGSCWPLHPWPLFFHPPTPPFSFSSFLVSPGLPAFSAVCSKLALFAEPLFIFILPGIFSAAPLGF